MERVTWIIGSSKVPGFRALAIGALLMNASAGCDRPNSDKAGVASRPPATAVAAPAATAPTTGPATDPKPAPSPPVAPSLAPGRPSTFAAVPGPPAATPPFEPADKRIAIAKSMLRGTRYADAQRALEVVLRDKPDIAQAEMLLGVALQKQKRYGEAKPHFERAIALRQSFPEVDHLFHFLGWCDYYLSDMQASRRAFEEHLRRVPDEPDSTFGLALVAMEEDRIDEAERLLQRSIASLQGNPAARRDISKARIRLADVYERLDRSADAERELREALRLYPDHYEAWAKLARVLDRSDRPVEAERARAEEQAAMRRVGRAPVESPGEHPDGSTPPSAPDDGPPIRPND